MTPAEETNERNACDEWFHEHKPVSIQEVWMERARRAEADANRYRKFVEIRDYYIWAECTPEQVAEILDDYITRGEGRD